ncbi:MAG: hypothetical protein ABSC50_09425 [Candidatus Bathyarchaeia archaeon]
MAQKEVPAARSTGQKLSELHEAIRREFPRVDADANGRRRIFFENAAGSLVLQRVVEAEARARLDYSANVVLLMTLSSTSPNSRHFPPRKAIDADSQEDRGLVECLMERKC